MHNKTHFLNYKMSMSYLFNNCLTIPDPRLDFLNNVLSSQFFQLDFLAMFFYFDISIGFFDNVFSILIFSIGFLLNVLIFS